MKAILTILLSVFLFCSNLHALTETVTLVDIGSDGRFVCRLIVATDDEGNKFYFNRLGKYTSATTFKKVGFKRQASRIRKLIRRLTRRIKRARKAGDTTTQATLTAKRTVHKETRQDLRDCRNKVGDYDDGVDLPPSGDGGGSGGDDDDGGDDTSTIDACEVATGVESDPNPLSLKIINGEECATPDMSGVVLVEILDSSDTVIGLCSGTVVGDRKVISAAHCFLGTADSADIVVGGTRYSASFSANPDFDINSPTLEDFDVAVLTTVEDLPTNTFSVIDDAGTLTEGEAIVIAGYGLDENGDSEVLRAGKNNISSFNSNAIFVFFSGDGESNTCSGDSGGPLFVQRGNDWVLAGVTSGGTVEDCSAGDLSDFASLLGESNRDFIDSIS